jgi:hypothetical protein
MRSILIVDDDDDLRQITELLTWGDLDQLSSLPTPFDITALEGLLQIYG